MCRGAPLGILLCLAGCQVLSRTGVGGLGFEGVGGLDSLNLSWSRGCEGAVAAIQCWFFILVAFLSIPFHTFFHALSLFSYFPGAMGIGCGDWLGGCVGMALLLLFTFSFSWARGGLES